MHELVLVYIHGPWLHVEYADVRHYRCLEFKDRESDILHAHFSFMLLYCILRCYFTRHVPPERAQLAPGEGGPFKTIYHGEGGVRPPPLDEPSWGGGGQTPSPG